MIHNLKIKKRYADRILTGEKTFEVRLNDRDYQKGDIIKFSVTDKKMPIQGGAHHEIEDMEFLISYIHTGYGMSSEFSRTEQGEYNYVILGIMALHVDEGSKDGQGTTNVEDIKEYIDEQKSIALLIKDDEVLSAESVVVTLDNIRSMLDKLETPIEIDTKKYFERINKLIDKEMAQYLKDQMKKALKKEIEKGE